MGKFIDLTGQRFGRWTVLERAENDSRGTARWFCQCDCGKQHIVRGYDLRSGLSRSCGCLQKEVAAKSNRKFFKRDMRLNRIWVAMRKRCSNPNSQYYYLYGGRGITVCQEWEANFGSFQNWAIENGYMPDLTIDRIDNELGYSPENCRWASIQEQANNHRNNVMITYKGQTLTVAQWSVLVGINQSTLRSRIAAGWPIKKALLLKPNTQNRIK